MSLLELPTPFCHVVSVPSLLLPSALSAASGAERSLAGGSLCPPARLSVCLVCLARSLPPSLALALPACLSPSPPPPPLPLRARLTFAAHHPEPQGGARARHAGTCSSGASRSARGAGGAAPAAPTARPGARGDPAPGPLGQGHVLVYQGVLVFPKDWELFPRSLSPAGGSSSNGGSGWERRGGV